MLGSCFFCCSSTGLWLDWGEELFDVGVIVTSLFKVPVDLETGLENDNDGL